MTAETTSAPEYVAVEPRMPHPATLLPGVTAPIHELAKVIQSAGVPASTLELVHFRVSQINGCAWCVNFGTKAAKRGGETDQRLHAVAVWREAPFFTAAERAALELTECATRIADRGDPVPDEVWDEAAKHFDERGLAALVLYVGLTNLVNRGNVAIRQPADTPMLG